MRIKLTEKEKALALKAASAADKLMHVWNYMNEDRSNDKDFEDALKHTKTLVAFGRMLEEKLRPELVEIPEPQPEETSPEAVEAPNPQKEPGDDARSCGHDPVEKLLADETVLGRLKRLFC